MDTFVLIPNSDELLPVLHLQAKYGDHTLQACTSSDFGSDLQQEFQTLVVLYNKPVTGQYF